MMPKLALLVAVVGLSACQQLPVSDETSPRSRIATGTVLTLHKPLGVPAGHARVYLQGGKVREKGRIKRYLPHCEFELTQVSTGSLRIQAGEFIITDRDEEEVEIVQRQAPRHYAATRLTWDSYAVPQLNRRVRYWLYAERQPLVRNLSCYGGFDDPWAVQYPSLADTRQALGEWVTIGRAD